MYPSGESYVNAVRNLNVCVIDPSFKGGQPRKTGFLIEQYAGGYSRVFPIRVGKKTLALRCFTSDVKDAKYRYQMVSTFFNQCHLDWFVDFEYVENGIRVKGKAYPIIRMEWFEGVTLKQFIQSNRTNASILQQTAHVFLDMVTALHQQGISHGDLQEENILIRKHGHSLEMKLIDYDSLYVPSLKHCKQQIVGKPNFQHPLRIKHSSKKVCDNNKVDFFSELVIYLSLMALAEKPALWNKFHVDQIEGLLFEPTDFLKPQQSQVIKDLKNLSPEIVHLCSSLEQFCNTKNLNQLIPLEMIVSQTSLPIATTPKAPKKKHTGLIMSVLFLLIVTISGGVWFHSSFQSTVPVQKAVSLEKVTHSKKLANQLPEKQSPTILEKKPVTEEQGRSKKQPVVQQSLSILEKQPVAVQKSPVSEHSLAEKQSNRKEATQTIKDITSETIRQQQQNLQGESPIQDVPEKNILQPERIFPQKRKPLSPVETYVGSIRPFQPKTIDKPIKKKKMPLHSHAETDSIENNTNQDSASFQDLLYKNTVLYDVETQQPLIIINNLINVTVVKYLRTINCKIVRFEAFARGFSVDNKHLDLRTGMELHAKPIMSPGDASTIGRLCTDKSFPITDKQKINDAVWYIIQIRACVRSE
jgi:serine/threonine protein kinase